MRRTVQVLSHCAARPRPALAAALLLATLGINACTDDEPITLQDVSSDSVSSDTATVQCKSDGECPLPTTACKVAACSASGVCGFADAPDGSACDDGSACTAVTACSAGLCIGSSTCECATDADCAKLEDSDACNGTLYCDLGGAAPACKIKPATIVTCDDSDDTACSSNTCQPATGSCVQTAKPDDTSCDDGNACTSADACANGLCAGQPSCACIVDDDCKASEDGNPCNGTLYCDTSGAEPACKVNPATIVSCNNADDTACFASQCDPNDGNCKAGPMPETTPCDLDGSSCSLDHCQGGACVPGPLDSPCNCKIDADCAPFDDGNFCNGVLFCNKASGFCELNPATQISCPAAADTACLRNQCAPQTGLCKMTPQPDGLVCNDGWDCTTGEVCAAGKCKAATDTCVCQATADCAKFEASNACAKLYCNKPEGVCKTNPATLTYCKQAGDPTCSVTACNKATGTCEVLPKNEGGPCEADGSWCTSLDVCTGGSCKPASSKCPCQADSECAAFDDDNACNGTLFCDLPTGTCLVNPASKVECSGDGDGPCKPNQCDPVDGACKALPLPDGVTCDSDGFVCTSEACDAGACKLVAEACLCWDDVDCAPFEDGDACNGKLYCNKNGGPPFCEVNPATIPTCPAPLAGECTVSACDPGSGACIPQPGNEQASCDDGNLCTKADACAGGLCVGAPIDVTAVCDDNNPCTDDSCIPGVGCSYAPNGVPCTDGDACTEQDTCDASTCTSKPVDCDDGQVCTADSCDKAKGCQHAISAGTLCDDGDACTDSDICSAGGGCSGAGPVDCDDTNPCTSDSCDKAQGCQHANTTASCDDGDACTSGDVCSKGTCVAGTPTDCNDGNDCTTDSCAVAKGCEHADTTAACDDGDACTKADVCAAGACQAGAPVSCDDNEVCTDDICDPKGGCVSIDATNGLACRDGDACDGGGSCSNGTCSAVPTGLFDNVIASGVPALRVTELVPLGSNRVGALCLATPSALWMTTDSAGKFGTNAPVTLNTPAGLTSASFNTALRVGNDIWLAGVGQVAGVGASAFFVKSDEGVYGPTILPEAALQVTSLTDAQWLGGDEIGYIRANAPVFAKMRTDGKNLAQLTLNLPGATLVPTAMAPAPGGDWLVVGIGKAGASLANLGLVRVQTTVGKSPTQVWSSVVPSGGTSGTPQSVAVAGNDVVFVAASVLVGSAASPKLFRLNLNNGALSGTVTLPDWTAGNFRRLLRTPEGVVALVGDRGAPGSSQPHMAILGLDGKPMAQRTLALPNAGNVMDALYSYDSSATGFGGFFVGGAANTTTPGATKPFVVAMNPTLVTACNAQGACAGKTPASCSDSDPCTLDSCDLSKGCVHVAAADSYACEDGNPCTLGDACAAGSCKGGAPNSCDDGNPCTTGTCGPLGCLWANLKDTPCVGGTCDGVGGCTVRPDVPTHGTSRSLGVYIDETVGYPHLVGYGYNQTSVLGNPSGLRTPDAMANSDDAQLVAVGTELACMVDSKGALSCVGFAGNKAHALSAPIDLGAPVTWIAGRGDTFCALTTKSDVWCWSGNLTPVKERGPPASGSWSGVTVGGQHACAWSLNGGAVCWGVGSFGQLGGGDQPAAPVLGADAKPVIVAADSTALTNVTAMCAGDLFTCARTSDSKVHCWGHNLYGQLGNGGGSIASAATPVTGTGNGNGFSGQLGAQSVHCGADFACVTAKNPTLADPNKFVEKTACWGRGDRGQIGNGGGKDVRVWAQVSKATGGPVPPAGRWLGNADVAICLRKGADGLCWGSNEGGLLGLFGGNGPPDPLVPSSPLDAITGKAIGERTALRGSAGQYCALDTVGGEVCWGRNDGGGIAAGDTAGSFDLATIGNVADATSYWRSPNIGCQAKATGLECWGDNRFGYALGFLVGGSGSYVKTATPLPGSANTSDVITGITHSCATFGTFPANTLYCWGRNQDGELGRGVSGGALGINVVVDTNNAKFTGVSDFALTANRTCALDVDGHAWCWGRNQYGESGASGTADVLNPKQIPTMKFSKIAVGGSQTCAIEATAKSIWCWGYNGGTAGNMLGVQNVVVTSSTPRKVVSAAQFVDVAITESGWTSVPSSSTTCAITTTGQVICWGDAGWGALGNGGFSYGAGSLPAATPSINNATQIVAGDRSFCVLRSDKTVACWGQRGYAQTGRGASGAYTAFNPYP